MVQEMAIDLLWLALLFSALGLNFIIVATIGLIVKNVMEKFKEGFSSKDSSK